MVGFQPLIPRSTASAPPSAPHCEPRPAASPPKPKKTFQGLAVKLPKEPVAGETAGEARKARTAVDHGGSALPVTPAVQVIGDSRALQIRARSERSAPSLHLPQNNTHLPRGSIPMGSRPPPNQGLHAQQSQDMVHAAEKATLEKSGTAKKRKIPSFSLEDSSNSSTPSPSSARKPAEKSSGLKNLGVLSLDVAGVKFYKANARDSKEGNKVTFLREPENHYDKNAIRIVCGQEQSQVGHVPRIIAATLAPLIDSSLIILHDGFITNIKRTLGKCDVDCKGIEVCISISERSESATTGLQKQVESKRSELLKLLKSESHGLKEPEICSQIAACASRANTPQQQQHSLEAQHKLQSECGKESNKTEGVQKRQRQELKPQDESSQLAAKGRPATHCQHEHQRRHQEQHVKQQTLQTLEALDVMPQILPEELFSNEKLYPPQIRWELVIQRGARTREVDSKPKLWQIALVPPPPVAQNFSWQPKDDIENASKYAQEHSAECILDFMDTCIMELLELQQQEVTDHRIAMRANIDATLQHAQKTASKRSLLREAQIAANKDRHEKMHKLLVASGQDWRASMDSLCHFEDDAPSLNGG